MTEWLKVTVLKTVVPLWHRGFESLSLRHLNVGDYLRRPSAPTVAEAMADKRGPRAFGERAGGLVFNLPLGLRGYN